MRKSSQAKPQLNLIILGDPGSGKATQTKLLGKHYQFVDFDMGKELSNLRKHDTKLDKIHKKTTDLGKLTPTKIVRGIISNKLASVSAQRGIVFDGFPKMLGEAQLISRIIKRLERQQPIVIYLSISKEEIVKRVSNRKGYYEKKFGMRADDNIRALKNRAKYYRINISEVIKFFSKNYQFARIDAEGSMQEVNKKVLNTITKLQRKNEKLHKK